MKRKQGFFSALRDEVVLWLLLGNVEGSKPKSKPKREKTEEEKKFRRRAKYFLVTQLVAVLVFLSLLGGSDDAELELDEDDDSVDYD
ncbi:hypothetical protein CQW23_31021 [Capsicum baccatum]|uniref:Uncharacterized protein n=1 Tax=Capsicum baccatum TaxID=33114 RepID=A0A2G2V8V4_CAPBA|nr:hypothetical protein CQW23_31021 [Capsicum baccatum]PHU24542.1 hypothetical protein BC332_09649 [Capsicum chinense]